MEPNKIFEIWDEARKRDRSVFRLKAPVAINVNDSEYEKEVKRLTNLRINLNLSTSDVADGLGLTRTTYGGFESFRGKENWIYVYALQRLFYLYGLHLEGSSAKVMCKAKSFKCGGSHYVQ